MSHEDLPVEIDVVIVYTLCPPLLENSKSPWDTNRGQCNMCLAI